MTTPSGLIEPIDVIGPRLRELLPSLTEVEVRRSMAFPNWQVRLYDAKHNLAMEEHIHPSEFHDMIEKDGTGWDAHGVHGVEAMERTIAMSLDPQYQDKPHRIPKPESGWRLSQRGEHWCRGVAQKFMIPFAFKKVEDATWGTKLKKRAQDSKLALIRHGEDLLRRAYSEVEPK